MNEEAAAPKLALHHCHVIVNPTRLLGMNDMERPRTYETREAADSECHRLNGAAGAQAYLVIVMGG